MLTEVKVTHVFREKSDGPRSRAVEWSDKIDVLVCARCGANDADVATATEQIADVALATAECERKFSEPCAQNVALRKRLAAAWLVAKTAATTEREGCLKACADFVIARAQESDEAGVLAVNECVIAVALRCCGDA